MDDCLHTKQVLQHTWSFQELFLKSCSAAPRRDDQLPEINTHLNSSLEGDFPQSLVAPVLTTQDLSNLIKEN